MTEPCGCVWDDRGNPVDLCDKHCPPYDEGLPTDEYLAAVVAGKGQLSDAYYE